MKIIILIMYMCLFPFGIAFSDTCQICNEFYSFYYEECINDKSITADNKESYCAAHADLKVMVCSLEMCEPELVLKDPLRIPPEETLNDLLRRGLD